MNQTFQVQGMTCGHCERSVTEALKAVDPAAEVKIDRAAGKVEMLGFITWSSLFAVPPLALMALWSEGWPAITAATNAVKIRYLAGYDIDSDGGEALPKMIRAAVLLVVGHLYANREASTEVALTHIPLGVESLLRPHRVRMGMA